MLNCKLNNLYLFKQMNVKIKLKGSFLLWVIFPTKLEQLVFSKACFSKGLKVDILKITKMKKVLKKKFSWLAKGGPVVISCSSFDVFREIVAMFYEKKLKNINKRDLFKNFNIMSGFLIACKFFDFIFPMDEQFFFFFKQFISLLDINLSFFYLVLIRITMVILISLMLIIKLFQLQLQRFFFLNLASLSIIASHAHKKSVS